MKSVLLLGFLLLTSLSLLAGGGGGGSGGSTPGPSGPPPPCAGNAPAGNTCAQAVPICDLNGYCGSTASSYGANYWSQLNSEFCGSIENNSFISFTASATSISFNVWVTSSQYGDGIQIMVFSAAGNCSGAVTSYLCWNPGNVPSGSTTLTANGLTPGNQYYIMIDGQAGDVANYVIGANSGISLPLDVTPQTSTICAGETVALTASGANGSYSWNASPDLNTTSGATVIASPPGPGTYTYTVNSTSGNVNCPSSATQTATITVNPCGCSVTAANSGPICAGGTINLTASNYPGGTYAWTGPNGFTSNIQNPTGISPPTAPGTYVYEVTLSGPSIQPCTSTTTVTVNALPPVSAGPDLVICNGGNATLSGSGATSYVWTNGVQNGIAFTPAANGTYTVTGTDANGCIATDDVLITLATTVNVEAGLPQTICTGQSIILTGTNANTYVWDNGVSNGVAFVPAATTTYTVTGTDATGCITTDQVLVTVNPLPVIDAGLDQTVCSSTPVTLSGSGGVSYTWNNGVVNGTPFTPLATTTYTVTGTDANGCQNTDNVLVTVNPVPGIFAGYDVTVCEGTPVTLTASGGTTYNWDNGVIQGNPFIQPVGTVVYTATNVDPNGCNTIDQVSVTVNPNPIVNAGADFTVCQNTAITLSATGANTYVWSTGASNGIPFPIQTTTNFTVTGTTAFGCVGTDDILVTVTPTPIPSLVPSQTSGCIPAEITFVNSSADLGNTFSWNFGTGTTVTGAGPITHTFFNSGCYDVTLVSTTPNGCVGTVTYPSLICVFANPVASFTPIPSTVNIIDPVSMMDNNSTGATNYIWSFGDSTGNSTEFQPTHVFPGETAGNYQIMLIAISSEGCRDTAYSVVTVQDELIFYVPNSFTPDGDQFNQEFTPVFTSGFDPYDYNMKIFNRWGEIVFESNDALFGWPGTFGVDGKLVPDGTYVWKIEFKTNYSDARKMFTGHITLIR